MYLSEGKIIVLAKLNSEGHPPTSSEFTGKTSQVLPVLLCLSFIGTEEVLLWFSRMVLLLKFQTYRQVESESVSRSVVS